jgi:NADH dehydrogenase [ubiquinone] 1 alpha subcomplex assembly factor 5
MVARPRAHREHASFRKPALPPPDPIRIFDRTLLAERRRRVAGGAAQHDFLLARVADELADRLAIVQRRFPLAANVGAHHGLLSRRIRGLAGVERIVDVDTTAKFLTDAVDMRVVADEEALPFADASIDLIVSALALQLVNDLPGTLVQMRRALRPDGLLLAALLGGATLRELRDAWLTAEAEISGGASPRVAPFADVRDLGGLLQRAGFALPVVDSETVTVTYADPLSLMREIKAMGASNMLVARRRQPVTRGLVLRAAEIYADRFGASDGRVPATFEIITLTAWAPDASQPKPLRPGSAQTRLADALGVKEGKLK